MTIGNTGGWRNYANTERRVAAPADLAGLKMRTVPADLPQELARALGAAPTPIPWPELFTSLQTGVVEGTANGITDIMSMKFPDAGPEVSDAGRPQLHGRLLVDGQRPLQGLTDDQKQIVAGRLCRAAAGDLRQPQAQGNPGLCRFQGEAGGDIYVPTPGRKGRVPGPPERWHALGPAFAFHSFVGTPAVCDGSENQGFGSGP
jgi:TRAP-type transport system periplasmic protein